MDSGWEMVGNIRQKLSLSGRRQWLDHLYKIMVYYGSCLNLEIKIMRYHESILVKPTTSSRFASHRRNQICNLNIGRSEMILLGFVTGSGPIVGLDH